MTYRIKIITRRSGIKIYHSQVRRLGFWWCGLMSDGQECWHVKEFYPRHSREEALDIIDKHYKGGKQTIEFEYITKP